MSLFNSLRNFQKLLKIQSVNNHISICLLSSYDTVAKQFFSEDVQDLLKKLTRAEVEKVYRRKKEGKAMAPPEYKFMTTAQYNEAKEEALKKMELKLKMPPVMSERKEIDNVLVKDPNLIGYNESTFVFVDISEMGNDRDRAIVVRDPDGTLRDARWDERDRMNQIYFPRPGRKLKPPVLFSSENLKKLFEEGEYEYILDRACCQFEPDDPMYIRVCEETYSAIDRESSYNSLRSTRHYGPMVFYLCRTKSIDNLLLENLATDRVEDAVWLITLYYIINPDANAGSIQCAKGKELDFIQRYIELDSKEKSKLELTLQTYKEYLSAPNLMEQAK